MEVVFFTVLACVLMFAQCMLVYTTDKAYGRDAAQTVCIAIVSGLILSTLVYLVVTEVRALCG